MDENTLTSPTGGSPFGLRSSLFLASLVLFLFYITWPFAPGFSSLSDSLLHRACNYLDNCHPFLFLLFVYPQLLFITSTAIAIDPAYCR